MRSAPCRLHSRQPAGQKAWGCKDLEGALESPHPCTVPGDEFSVHARASEGRKPPLRCCRLWGAAIGPPWSTSDAALSRPFAQHSTSRWCKPVAPLHAALLRASPPLGAGPAIACAWVPSAAWCAAFQILWRPRTRRSDRDCAECSVHTVLNCKETAHRDLWACHRGEDFMTDRWAPVCQPIDGGVS